MSTSIDRFARRQEWKFHGKGPNGRNLCHCGCGREVQPPRRTSFSDACVSAWKSRNDPATIASILRKRDRCICALCGVDTEALRRCCVEPSPIWPPDIFAIAVEMGYANQYEEAGENHWRGSIRPDVEAAHEVAYAFWIREVDLPWRAFQEERRRELAAIGFTDTGRRWWEADHIVPVAEGGGGCGPEGYRTLCLSCHRTETAKLAARLAAKRKVSKQPELPLLERIATT